MSKKTIKCLAWFVVGQISQIVLALVANVSYMNRPILFCAAAGFLVTVAICAGAKLAAPEKKEPAGYLEFAREK